MKNEKPSLEIWTKPRQSGSTDDSACERVTSLGAKGIHPGSHLKTKGSCLGSSFRTVLMELTRVLPLYQLSGFLCSTYCGQGSPRLAPQPRRGLLVALIPTELFSSGTPVFLPSCPHSILKMPLGAISIFFSLTPPPASYTSPFSYLWALYYSPARI